MITRLYQNLQIVILDCPIATWDSPQTQKLFCRLLSLKLNGYGKEYPEGVTSLDASDFFGTHLLICRTDEHGELEPLMGYRSISLKRAEFFRITFPALTTLRAGGAEKFEPAIKKIISDCLDSGHDISFDSSWTKSPKLDKEFTKYLRGIITTIGTLYHLESDIKEWFTCGIFRFKTDEYFRYLGAKDVTEPFGLFSSANEKCVMLHLKKPSVDSLRESEEFRSLWQKRLHISPEKAAAAPALKKAA
jgi:hypothetical protein